MQVINFKGKISNNQWDKFQEKVKEIAKDFNLEIIPESLQNTILVKLDWNGWRGFYQGIHEHFTCTPEEWELIFKELKGKNIYFGEIAGKHSEVDGFLDEVKDIQIITDHQSIKDFNKKHGNYHNSGHSFLQTYLEPLQYEDPENHKRFKKLIQNIVD